MEGRIGIKRIGIITLLLVVMAVALLAGCTARQTPSDDVSIGNSPSGDSSSGEVKEDITITAQEVGDKVLFKSVTVEGVEMKLIAVKASDGGIRMALNTCQVCYDSGRGYYKEDKGVLVCQNCGNRFSKDDVGQPGNGCNPVPVEADQTDQGVAISQDTLAVLVSYFK